MGFDSLLFISNSFLAKAFPTNMRLPIHLRSLLKFFTSVTSFVCWFERRLPHLEEAATLVSLKFSNRTLRSRICQVMGTEIWEFHLRGKMGKNGD